MSGRIFYSFTFTRQNEAFLVGIFSETGEELLLDELELLLQAKKFDIC